MKDNSSGKARLNAVRGERRIIIEKIWQGERSIKRLQERLKQLDAFLLKKSAAGMAAGSLRPIRVAGRAKGPQRSASRPAGNV
jgi:hypothetical protein